MRKLLTFSIFILVAGNLFATEIREQFAPGRYFDTLVPQRGWVIRGGYIKQDGLPWGELGIGRMNRLEHFDFNGKGTTSAAANFTFGLEAGFGDTSLILSPKLAVEISSILLGARVSYGYFMQDNNATGVIGIEGGFNVVSVFYVYAGYNFVKGNQEHPVVHEGLRISVGINYAFGMKDVDPPKSSTHL